MQTLKRLDDQARRLERTAGGRRSRRLSPASWRRSPDLDGRSVFGWEKDHRGRAKGALRLKRMKIATFNINNVNRRLPNLLHWLKTAKPDVVCLQELKCTDDAFPAEALAKAGYAAVWRGQRTWNGVAILARGAEPVITRTALPGDADDAQARYIEAAVGGILIGCIYLPNGNPQPGPKFDYKLAWLKRLAAHARRLLREDMPVVLAGDYNVAPTDIDIYPDDILGRRRAHPAAEPVRVRAARQAGLDGRAA